MYQVFTSEKSMKGTNPDGHYVQNIYPPFYLSHPRSPVCPPVLTFTGANFYLGSSCPYSTSRPRGLLPRRDTETGKKSLRSV